ncbi:MAG: acyl-CoA dehydrogenase family protein, partial [Solimonas sp.]
MSEHQDMLADAVTRLFRDAGDVAARAGQEGWPSALWAQVESLGLPLVLVSEAQGGVGGDWEDVLAILHAAGYFSIPLPVGEAMLGARLATGAGFDVPAGVLTIAAEAEGRLHRDGDIWVFTGQLRAVPWGRVADTVVALLPCEGRLHTVLLPRVGARIRQAQNLAGEPRDNLEFDAQAVPAAPVDGHDAGQFRERCALLRIAQITGALEAALHRSIEY